MTSYNFSSRDLKELLNDCSSVKKEIKLPDGRKRYIWKKRAVLNSDGNPISLENFMAQERNMYQRIDSQRNSREEVKQAKKEYAEYMLNKFGKNWRTEVKGAIVKLTTFRHLSILLK
jgi:hypothetical protein